MFIVLIGMYSQAEGQSVPDSVKKQYESAKTNKEKLTHLYRYLYKLQGDTSFSEKSDALVEFLKSVNDTENLDLTQLIINDQLAKTGDYATALASSLEITSRFEKDNNKGKILQAYRNLSTTYYYAGDRELDIVYGKKALQLARELNDRSALAGIANNLSTSYSQKSVFDSALVYGRMAVNYAKQYSNADDVAMALGTLAEAFISGKQYDSALIYLRAGSDQNDLGLVWSLNDFSQVFLETNQYDSSKYYAHRAIELASSARFQDQLQRAYEYLAMAYHKTYKPDSAYRYLQLAVSIKDSLHSQEKTQQVRVIMAREQARLQQMEKDKLDFQNKIKMYGLISGLLILTITAFLLYRNNQQKQKTNVTLQEQKTKVENTLQELKVTQQQLIQSEKMASLGELTAGIAHEIQNPLNFVNNFSEINTELIEELTTEVKKGNLTELATLANTIKDNEQKINHHGKRAGDIVKGMLQHSRMSSGQKELADINALADEYLRLAYHGLKAKDKTFNAKFESNLDAAQPKINVVPQDIGRVILNLINNAFYAVSEKSTLRQAQGDTNYEPTVTVTTKKMDNKVLISIKDNGNGIPQKVQDKIFQPFFTTKPTGQGTGLGLSLSYDIVKAHGGELKVETLEGKGSIFIIQIPA